MFKKTCLRFLLDRNCDFFVRITLINCHIKSRIRFSRISGDSIDYVHLFNGNGNMLLSISYKHIVL